MARKSYMNVCDDCGWEEPPDEVNEHRRVCPECGAPFQSHEVIRVFFRA